MKKLVQSAWFFHLSLAALMVAGRLAFFDHELFAGKTLPNHDMGQGLAFFCTNMHSLRLSGDLAWWNPLTNNGYAQYFQAFLSPLAPTPHHITFILWSQAMRGLNACRVLVPEYTQYLAVNYVVLPFLTFLAFSFIAGQLFRRRATVVLVVVGFTFSGIGLWYSAWFYFQESCTLFFLLGAGLAVLRRPTRPRLLLFLAAVLLQLTSVNYWTIYNSWFIALFAAAQACLYPNRFRRLGRRVTAWAGAAPVLASALAALVVGVTALWLVLVGSTVAEQAGNYVRSSVEHYTIRDAFNRTQEARRFTTELFNPNLERSLHSFPAVNEMHNFRYVGCFLLPLLLVGLVRRWSRRDRFLVAAATGVLVICLAPPFLLLLWDTIPFTNRVVHLFNFYTHYWELLVLLLGGSGLDYLLKPGLSAAARRWSVILVGSLLALMALLFVVLGSATDFFPAGHPGLQGNLLFAVLVGVTSLVILQHLLYASASSRRLLVFVLLALAVTDLTRYFWIASNKDREFSVREYPHPDPLTEEMRARLFRPWPGPEPTGSFEAGVLKNLPVVNEFWPHARFLGHVGVKEVLLNRSLLGAVVGAPGDFYPAARRLDDPKEAAALVSRQPELMAENRLLFLQGDPKELPAVSPAPAPAPGARGACKVSRWSYNAFELQTYAPASGWLYLRQVYDPLWHVWVDGRPVKPVRANFGGLAFPLTPGRHQVTMDYRPLARNLYAPACWLLEGTLTVLAGLGLWAGRRQNVLGVRLVKFGRMGVGDHHRARVA